MKNSILENTSHPLNQPHSSLVTIPFAVTLLSAALMVGSAIATEPASQPVSQPSAVELSVGEPLPDGVQEVRLHDIAGTWKSWGDTDGKKEAKALIRVTENNGVYQAVIQQPLTEEGKTKVCTECPGAQKGKPFKGLKIMDGVKRNADTGEWDGGQILDPEKGKEYRVSMKLLDGGTKLEVTGHLFVFSRSQVWTREQ